MMKEMVMKKMNVKYEFYGIDQDTSLVFFGDGKGSVKVKALGELVRKLDKQENTGNIEPALVMLVDKALFELDGDRRARRRVVNRVVA
jgi:hypothetical protein